MSELASVSEAPPTIFLLSPANVSGIRAKQLVSPRAKFPAALAYQSESGVAIEEAFAFMSALYFRGKVAYARRFGRGVSPVEPQYVIVPGFGLVPFGWALDAERFKKLKRTDVDVDRPSYRKPLEKAARELSDQLPPEARVVLLGSVATGKYLDILQPVFGARLHFPRVFAGIGDMSRGGLMLRAARSGEELEYAALDGRKGKVKVESVESGWISDSK